VLIDFNTGLLSGLADVHARFAQSDLGIPNLPRQHWERLFTRPEIDPRNDVFILGSQRVDEDASVDGFAWLYTKSAPSRVYIRGPYTDPDAGSAPEVIELLLENAVARAEKMGVGYIEGRALYPPWAGAYESAGFRKMGAYSRLRLFPLVGTVAQGDVPEGGGIRGWEGLDDLQALMEIFTACFGDHWDYVPPERTDWIEILNKGRKEDRFLGIATEGGRSVGYVFGQRVPELSMGAVDTSYLVSIGVHPGHRGEGWGRALLGHWLRACYEGGIRSVELDMDESNRVAGGLYDGFGFKVLRVEDVWRRDL